MSRCNKWPTDIIQWLRDNTPGKTSKELADMANAQGLDKKIGKPFTPEAIKRAKNRYKVKSGTPRGNPKGYSRKYPQEMEEYIRSIATERYSEEIAQMTSEHFGIDFTVQQCRAYMKNHNIQNGCDCRFHKGGATWNKGKPMRPETYAKCAPTMFKKGSVPHNHMSVGEYTHTSDGYLIQKVSETGSQHERFEFVHRAVYEKHHGPIPEGKMVSFLDGDKDNCNINNLALLDRSVSLEMTRQNLRFNNPELTAVGITVSELRVKARRRKVKAKR